MFSLNEFDAVLPDRLKGTMNQQLMDDLNKIITEPEFAEHVRNNLISYTMVLRESRFTLEDYMKAVIYVSFKLMGYTDKECYQRTFPDRYARLLSINTSSKDIAAYIAAYNRGKLVNLIYEQTQVPTWVLNQDIYQKAINTQLELMLSSKSDKVRTDAANSLLVHLKRPEAAKVDISFGVREDDGVKDLMKQMRDMVSDQKAMIEAGASTKDVAHQRIIQHIPNELDHD